MTVTESYVLYRIIALWGPIEGVCVGIRDPQAVHPVRSVFAYGFCKGGAVLLVLSFAQGKALVGLYLTLSIEHFTKSLVHHRGTHKGAIWCRILGPWRHAMTL